MGHNYNQLCVGNYIPKNIMPLKQIKSDGANANKDMNIPIIQERTYKTPGYQYVVDKDVYFNNGYRSAPSREQIISSYGIDKKSIDAQNIRENERFIIIPMKCD